MSHGAWWACGLCLGEAAADKPGWDQICRLRMLHPMRQPDGCPSCQGMPGAPCSRCRWCQEAARYGHSVPCACGRMGILTDSIVLLLYPLHRCLPSPFPPCLGHASNPAQWGMQAVAVVVRHLQSSSGPLASTGPPSDLRTCAAAGVHHAAAAYVHTTRAWGQRRKGPGPVEFNNATQHSLAVLHHAVTATPPFCGRAGGRVDIVLDNSGLELYADLALADYLVASGLASEVVLHGKQVGGVLGTGQWGCTRVGWGAGRCTPHA